MVHSEDRRVGNAESEPARVTNNIIILMMIIIIVMIITIITI